MLTDNQNSSERILNLKTHNKNASVRSPAKRMKLDDTRYQCVVCQSNKASLSELHWHQTYQHSTEELSLSVIGWKGLVKVVSAPKKLSSQMEKENNMEQRSIWNSFSKKPSQFYYLSSSILRVNGDQSDNAETPIDCTVVPLSEEKKVDDVSNGVGHLYDVVVNDKVEVEEAVQEEEEEEEVEDGVQEVIEEIEISDSEEEEVQEVIEEHEEKKVHEVDDNDEEDEEVAAVVPKSCSVPLVRVERYINIPIVPKDKVTVNFSSKEEVLSEEELEFRGFDKSSIDVSLFDRYIDMRVLKKELCSTREISMEDFIKSANGLCHELEDYKRLAALKKSLRRRNIL